MDQNQDIIPLPPLPPLEDDGAPNLVVRSNIREYVGDLSVAADFGDALQIEVARMLGRAVGRAKANNRKTVMPRDL